MQMRQISTLLILKQIVVKFVSASWCYINDSQWVPLTSISKSVHQNSQVLQPEPLYQRATNLTLDNSCHTSHGVDHSINFTGCIECRSHTSHRLDPHYSQSGQVYISHPEPRDPLFPFILTVWPETHMTNLNHSILYQHYSQSRQRQTNISQSEPLSPLSIFLTSQPERDKHITT